MLCSAALVPLRLLVPWPHRSRWPRQRLPTYRPRCFPVTDNGDPVLTSLDFTPRAVDSRNGAQTMTFTVTAEDTGGPGAPTGVARGWIRVSYDNTDTENWNLLPR